MTEFVWRVGPLAAETARLFAQVLAFKLQTGDCVALSGDVGAGKTTLARSIIRAIAAEPELDVASPTYALMQSYESSRANIQHYDFYRLGQAEDVLEIGFEDGVADCITLVEWPERAEEILPDVRLSIDIEEVQLEGDAEARIYQLTAGGDTAQRLQRVKDIWQFLTGWMGDDAATGDVTFSYLQGDASARAYAVLESAGTSWILMDSPRQPDGPPIRDGKSYSQFAHLAEDICPFIAIANELSKNGFSVPEIDAADFERGLAVVENLGPNVFGSLIASGRDKAELYRAATDVLVELAKVRVPDVLTIDGHTHVVPTYSQSVLLIETELLLDWYVPWSAGEAAAADERQEFLALWTTQLRRLDSLPRGWALRDFHSPNLLWLPERTGKAQVGLIDFQDAQVGHAAYDLVSLLQDARLDIEEPLETELLAYYCAQSARLDTDFNETAFRWAYAVLGAQRNTKILGIFARLAQRDGKPQYLRHIPRITRYVRRNLRHPDLAPLNTWYEQHLPGFVEE